MTARFFYILTAIALPIIGHGQDTGEQTVTLAEWQAQVVAELNKQRVAAREDAKMHQELWRRLQDELRNQAQTIAKLEHDNTALADELKKTRLAHQQQLTELTDALASVVTQANKDREQLAAREKRLLNELTNELTKLLKSQPNGTSTTNPTPSGATYTVEKGDTLGAIAAAFEVPLAKLKAANGLEGDTIYIGQNLKIPK